MKKKFKIRKIIYNIISILIFTATILVTVLLTSKIDKLMYNYIGQSKEYKNKNEYNVNFDIASKHVLITSYFVNTGISETKILKNKDEIYNSEIYKKIKNFSVYNNALDIKKYEIWITIQESDMLGELVSIVGSPFVLLYSTDEKNIYYNESYIRDNSYEKVTEKKKPTKDYIIEDIKQTFSENELFNNYKPEFDYVFFDNFNNFCQLEDKKNNIYIYYDMYYMKIKEFMIGFEIDLGEI